MRVVVCIVGISVGLQVVSAFVKIVVEVVVDFVVAEIGTVDVVDYTCLVVVYGAVDIFVCVVVVE